MSELFERRGTKDGNDLSLGKAVAGLGGRATKDEVVGSFGLSSGCRGLKEVCEEALFDEVDGVGWPELDWEGYLWLLKFSKDISISMPPDMSSYMDGIPPNTGAGAGGRGESLLLSGILPR